MPTNQQESCIKNTFDASQTKDDPDNSYSAWAHFRSLLDPIHRLSKAHSNVSMCSVATLVENALRALHDGGLATAAPNKKDHVLTSTVLDGTAIVHVFPSTGTIKNSTKFRLLAMKRNKEALERPKKCKKALLTYVNIRKEVAGGVNIFFHSTPY